MTIRSEILWWTLLAFGLFGAWCMCRGDEMPTLPKVVPSTRPPAVHYFVCTAQANGLESEWSNEAVFTNAPFVYSVRLAWNYTNGPITNFNIYKGRASRTYTNVYACGTNLVATVPLAPPLITNFIISVIGLGTNWRGTNVTGMRWFKGTNMTIKIERF